ncbi:MAG: hypothetical protein Q4C95_12795 [Planctomycetia bacterium]|nr:hypothetical protein [Planctomycetia bacterium]
MLLLAVGCGRKAKPSDLPTLYPCEITVIQDEKPLSDALVTIMPLNGDLRFTIGGKTNAEGKTKPMLDGEWEGVPQGEYLVAISKIITPDLPEPSNETSMEERIQMRDEKIQQTKQTVAPPFSSLTKSSLRLKIEGKPVTQSFDIGEAVSISLDELNGTPRLP